MASTNTKINPWDSYVGSAINTLLTQELFGGISMKWVIFCGDLVSKSVWKFTGV
jgi:hypothetical protein